MPALIGKHLCPVQEHWPFSLRADTDVKLAWLQASAFKEAGGKSLSGDQGVLGRI